jgi:TonB family protein
VSTLMLDLKTLVAKTGRRLLPASQSRKSAEPTQRRTMVIALTLLLVALGVVLYRDRDFWFPDTQDADDQALLQGTAPASTSPPQTTVADPVAPSHQKAHPPKSQPNASSSADVSAPPMTATTTRTVLAPLEVEVVAGDVHRTINPGTNSVKVDLRAGSPPQPVSPSPAASVATDTAAGLTSKAAEHVQMSVGTAEVVSRQVTPAYPMLARQMKVQGSVTLQALIGRDGLIQDLRVLSGPPILAGAAREAVRQWHFKPHYQGAEAVETQANITVNFTISTN